jgi:hypothetical protein
MSGAECDILASPPWVKGEGLYAYIFLFIIPVLSMMRAGETFFKKWGLSGDWISKSQKKAPSF